MSRYSSGREGEEYEGRGVTWGQKRKGEERGRVPQKYPIDVNRSQNLECFNVQAAPRPT